MAQTSREIVNRCLKFEHPERMPRELWALPWASDNIRPYLDEADRRFPSDFGGTPNVYRPSSVLKGDAYVVGAFTDEWGCKFTNVQKGVHGEPKVPLIENIEDWKTVKPPYETLPENETKARDEINRACAATTKYVRSGCCARPWERYQFIRTTQNAMIDVMSPEDGARDLIRVIHEYHLKEMEFWASTDVDALNFMDDWGSQRQLLIPPTVWRELFKPLYRDYCQIAHSHGKAIFMHTDGYITEIYPDLVELGVDAVNSQLFCMDMTELAKIAKGKLTFWGEIDRQHVLPSPDPQVVRDAVRKVARHLYDPAGGIMIQFEATPGTIGPNVITIYEEWEKVEAEVRAKSSGTPSDRKRKLK
jgi:uroporphyrinogen decarboxylase